MRTDFMASAKQIAWRKKFARMSKAGVFRKKSKVRKPDGSRQSDFIPQYKFDEARRKKEGKPSIFAKPTESEYTGKWSRRYWKNKTKNVYAYIDFKNGKYYVITFRKNASPQWFKHKAMTLSEAQSYADGFNFQNK